MGQESRLGELLSLWGEQLARGRDVPAAELCRDQPELLGELERRLDQLRHFGKLAERINANRAETTSSAPSSAKGDGTATVLEQSGADAAPCFDIALPGYEILGKLGRGGMGVVYQARHLRLGRVVALKMIRAGDRAEAVDRVRFRTEAEAMARVQHAHVVQVFEVGEHEGQPFFSLEFCSAGSLDTKLTGTPWPAAEAAALVEKLARGIAAAHHKGVLHRDLKPANILLTEEGTPKISDFGLAKRLDLEGGHTLSGAIMGTPSYMAPEQAAGQTRQLGPPTDVYALGAILYELLTGRPPFRAASPLDTVRQVLEEEPVPVRRLQPGTSRDVETICHKCLEKDPQRRYTSAEALADDLRRFQSGEPVLARPVGMVGRTVKWARRRPTAAALVAVLLVGTLSFLAVILLYTWRLRAALALAEQHQQQAEDNAREARAAIDQYYVRASENILLRHPQFLPLRKSLLETAAAYYRGLLPKLRGDPLLRQDLAKTCRSVGRITTLVGSFEESLPYMREYCDLAAEAARENPADLSLKAEWARALAQWSHVLKMLKRADEARPLFLQCIAIWEQLAASDPAKYAHELAYQYDDMSSLLMDLYQDGGGAWDYLHKGLAIMEPLVEKNPDNEEYVRGIAYFYNNRGELYAEKGNLNAALEDHKRAIQIREKMVRDHPQDRKYDHRKWLARSLTRVAEVEWKLGKRDQAAQHFAAARDRLVGLVDGAPANLYYREDLAKCCQEHGRLLLERKQWLDAFAAFKMAGDSWEKTADAGSRGMDARLDCARARTGAGQALAELGRRPEADVAWQRAVEQLREAVKRGFKDVGSLKQDGDLKPLQDRADFKSLCGELEQKGMKVG